MKIPFGEMLSSCSHLPTYSRHSTALAHFRYIDDACGARAFPTFPDAPDTSAVPNWTPAKLFDVDTFNGEVVRLETVDPSKHSGDLYGALDGPGSDPERYYYTIYGPFEVTSVHSA